MNSIIIKKCLNKLFSPKVIVKGENYACELSKNSYFRKVKIKIFGSNNKVIVRDGAYLHNVNISIGFPDCPINNCMVFIGENSTFNSANMQLGEDESFIKIGNDCMFSFNVELSCSDTHSILDKDNRLINIGKSIEIGNHVWICKDTAILKNTKIPDNCIVAQKSTVTKKFLNTDCIIAGNPAKEVKQNIKWNRERPQKLRKEN